VVAGSPPLVKFGVPVQYVAGGSAKKNTAFAFTSVRIQGETAEVELKYPPEGIVGKATLVSSCRPMDKRWRQGR